LSTEKSQFLTQLNVPRSKELCVPCIAALQKERYQLQPPRRIIHLCLIYLSAKIARESSDLSVDGVSVTSLAGKNGITGAAKAGRLQAKFRIKLKGSLQNESNDLHQRSEAPSDRGLAPLSTRGLDIHGEARDLAQVSVL
jgi:hypothetical protein